MKADLQNKVFLVTGASRGIGYTVAQSLLLCGAKVAVCSRQPQSTIADLYQNPDPKRFLAVSADVSKEDDVKIFFRQAADHFGQIHGVVSNAGVNQDALLIRQQTQQWDSVLATNLTGSFLVAKTAIEHYLTQQSSGQIIFMGSLSQTGFRSQSAYATSKGALLALSRAIAKDYQQSDIRSNVLVCGFVKTDMSNTLPEAFQSWLVQHAALKRSADAEEVAATIRFLLSEKSASLNGQAVYVSGGLMELQG